MTLRGLTGLALLILVFSAFAHAQSLGDIARQYRAERQQSGTPNLKVYTNDDIGSSAPAEPAKSETTAQNADNKTAKKGVDNAAAADAESAPAKTGDSSVKKELPKSETDLRTEEINQHYLNRIKEIRTKLNAAQKERARLLQEQATSTFDYRRSLNTFPNPEVYENEQRSFKEEIQVQDELITSLSSDLEDAQEAARHAGVPHATD